MDGPAVPGSAARSPGADDPAVGSPPGQPPAIRATAADLPPAVVAAIAAARSDLSGARRSVVVGGGIPWAVAEWGDPAAPALVLLHGVTSDVETFWRLAPGLAASGRRVVAVDLPGHGRTGHWQGRLLFVETAAEVAGFLRAAGLEHAGQDGQGLVVLGHSWGAMVAAALPAAGIRPARIVLLDPPALPVAAMERMTHDPTERPYEDLATATAAMRAANPGWTDGDVRAKALGLTQFDPDAVLAILVGNGDWDAGLGGLADPAAAGIPVWAIIGEMRAGGMVPDAALHGLVERVGPGHVLRIADGPHSPQRTHLEATLVAILRALA